MKSKTFYIIIFLLYLFYTPLTYAKGIKILALDIYGDKQASKRWASTISYLNEKIPEHSFSILCINPYEIQKMKTLIKNKKVDFIITQPAIYVDLELNMGVSKILTLIKEKDVSQLGSVIFTKSDSKIKSIKDIKNKKIAAVAPLGFGGWLIGYNEMLKNGINPLKKSKVSFLETQFNVVKAVLDGKYDVGVIRTGLIEKLISLEKIKLSDINIINQTHHKNFTQISSSELYPEWAFANTPNIENSISKKVATALLSIPKGGKIALSDNYWEWTTPYDYKPVHDLLKKLEVGAYKDYKKITFEKYKKEILFIIGAFIIIITLLVAIFRRNIIIKKEEKLNRELQENIFRTEKLTSMGELLGNIAHQWRQPLSVISSAATGLQVKYSINDLDEKDFNLACDAIFDNTQYLSRTIENFTNYIKNEEQKEHFDMKKTINNFLYFIEGSMETYNINIIVDIEDKEFYGYSNKLIQCFINLFNNSKVQFEELNLQDRYIFIKSKMKDDYLIIEFKDNAKGIDEKILKNIFEPYFTTKHKSLGKGLGLHNTYNIIVNEMAGDIKAQNIIYTYNQMEFKGLNFTIKLPKN